MAALVERNKQMVPSTETLRRLESKVQSRDREEAVNERQLRRTTLGKGAWIVRTEQVGVIV